MSCDRDVCMTNDYNGISCDECECDTDFDFTADHPKMDMSNVNRIRVNDKVFLAADKVLDMIDGWLYKNPPDYRHIGRMAGEREALTQMRAGIKALMDEENEGEH